MIDVDVNHVRNDSRFYLRRRRQVHFAMSVSLSNDYVAQRTFNTSVACTIDESGGALPSCFVYECAERILPGVHLDSLDSGDNLIRQSHPLVSPHGGF